MDAPLAQTPANFGPKRRFFGKLVSNPSCVPNLKLLASTVAEISRGSQFFLDAPLAQTPSNFGPKRCFWQATSRIQVSAPIVKHFQEKRQAEEPKQLADEVSRFHLGHQHLHSAVICSGALLFSSRVLCPSLVTLCSHESGRCAVELYHASHLWYPPFYT